MTSMISDEGERWLHGTGAAERKYPTSKFRNGGCEEIPHIQGKELWLRFDGAAMKRYPTSKVRSSRIIGPLTKCGLLEKGMANHFGILTLRTP